MKYLIFLSFLFISVSSFAQSADTTLTSAVTVDPKATVVSYKWTQTAGPVHAQFSDSTSKTFHPFFTVAGNYSFHFVATDSQGQQATYDAFIGVNGYVYIKPQAIVFPASSPDNMIKLTLK